MVASSLEVARRAYKKFIKGWFYPKYMNVNNLQNLWKEDVDWSSWTWKEIHRKIKESKVRYRFPLDEMSRRSYRLKSLKSCVTLYTF